MNGTTTVPNGRREWQRRTCTLRKLAISTALSKSGCERSLPAAFWESIGVSDLSCCRHLSLVVTQNPSLVRPGRRGRRFKSFSLDLENQQLVAFIHGELFLVCQRQLARSVKLIVVGSNSCAISDYEEKQFPEPAFRQRVAKFNSSRHFPCLSQGFDFPAGRVSWTVMRTSPLVHTRRGRWICC